MCAVYVAYESNSAHIKLLVDLPKTCGDSKVLNALKNILPTTVRCFTKCITFIEDLRLVLPVDAQCL